MVAVAGITHEEVFNMSDIKDDKSMSSGGKEGGGKEGTDRNKTGTERQPGAGSQPGQREQSTGQPGSGGQQGGQNLFTPLHRNMLQDNETMDERITAAEAA